MFLQKVDFMKRHVYFALIDDGLNWRAFRDMRLMCDLFNLDYEVIRRMLAEKGYWVGLGMTIFKGELESRKRHRGRL